MKAQIAIEFLVIVSVALMIILPVTLYANKLLIGYKDDTKISLAKNTVNKLGENVDWVFSQGPSAKRTLEIYIPDDINEISLNNNMILFKVETSAGISDVFYETVPPLQGSLSKNSGYYLVSLTAYRDYVNITVVG